MSWLEREDELASMDDAALINRYLGQRALAREPNSPSQREAWNECVRIEHTMRSRGRIQLLVDAFAADKRRRSYGPCARCGQPARGGGECLGCQLDSWKAGVA